MSQYDDLLTALERLLAASGTSASAVRADAEAVAAVVSRKSPGAADAWAEVFDTPAAGFRSAVGRGEAYIREATPVLARLKGQGDAAADAYARRLADLAIAAASLGELTISALGTATVLGNAQLLAVGVEPPVAPPIATGSHPVSDGHPIGASSQQLAAAATAEEPEPPAEPEKPLPTLEELLAELEELVGLDAIKTEVRHQTQVLRVEALRKAAGLKVPDMTRHLVFVGNPGTGKTTVARLVAGIYRASGVLPKGHLVECDRSQLVAGYVGQTALKTSEMITKALGGALFIDEAYALATDDFGGEAVDTLVKAMEDHRDELLVIVAGYPAPMAEFIGSNPGLESRFRLTLAFEDYTDDELIEIFSKIAAGADFTPAEECVQRLRDILKVTMRGEGFGNGRFVRTMFESAVVRQAWRLRDVKEPDVTQLRELCAADLEDDAARAGAAAATEH